MRIDDENKVVWCSEGEMEWYVSFNVSVGNTMIGDMRRIASLSTDKEMVMRFNVDGITRLKMINAIAEGYEFKLEQPQKDYWRKKKEHLVWFEKIEGQFLNIDCIDDRLFLSTADREWQEVSTIKCVFTSQEARDLLKDDFDKFEKVECE